MNTLALHVALAFLWMTITGGFTGPNLLAGLLVGYLVIAFADAGPWPGRYVRRVFAVVAFVFFFFIELAISNYRVARAVLSPRGRVRPGILRVPLRPQGPGSATVFANVITLTPGTLSVDLDMERRALYVHVMLLGDPETERAQLKQQFERRILKVIE